MAKVKEATETKEAAEAALAIVLARVKDVQARVAALDKKLSDAVTEKENVEAQAARCLDKLSIAERLVNGLADEYKRWTATVGDLKDLGLKLIGNCLLASAFVGYISPFSAKLRKELWAEQWSNDIKERGIPVQAEIDPLKVLATDADVANWQNE